MSQKKSGDSRETIIAGALALIADRHAEMKAVENYKIHYQAVTKWYK